jgi:hypothetical protein
MPDDRSTAPQAKSRTTLAWSIQKKLAIVGLAIGVIVAGAILAVIGLVRLSPSKH